LSVNVKSLAYCYFRKAFHGEAMLLNYKAFAIRKWESEYRLLATHVLN